MSQKKILVVDDEELLRSSIAFEVELLGHFPVEAADGQEAFQKVLDEKVDLIISDIRMPKWDGGVLLGELRKVHRQMPPMILMSGYSDLSPKVAYDRGADDLIAKPFKANELSRIIEKFLSPLKERWTKQVDKKLSTSVEIKCGGSLEACPGKFFGIGRGGFTASLSFFSNTPKPGEFVNYSISYSEGSILSILGVGCVKWITQDSDTCIASAGVEFVSVDSNSIDVLIEFIESQDEISYIPVLLGCEKSQIPK